LATIVRPPIDVFAAQLALVASWADLRADRAAEILSQLGPQGAFWAPVLNVQPHRTPWTLELIATVLRFATFVEQRFKHELACRRPAEFAPQVQPMIPTPGHGALPSGHATEAFAVARVLLALAPDRFGGQLDEMLMRQAARIAINRTIAGVHFPVDSAAGQMLGLVIGEYLLARCGVANLPSPIEWKFDGPAYPGDADFDFRQQYDTTNGTRRPPHTATTATATPWLTADAPVSTGAAPKWIGAPIRWLWQQATKEW